MGFEGLGRGAVCTTVEEGNGGEQQEEMCAEEVEKRRVVYSCRKESCRTEVLV
jgi:hypothetical protein